MSRDGFWPGGVFFRGGASRAGVRSRDLSRLGLCKAYQCLPLWVCNGHVNKRTLESRESLRV